MLVAGADAVLRAEGNTQTQQRPSVEVPPGPKSRARSQGFPRNLEDLAVSVEKPERAPDSPPPGSRAVRTCPRRANTSRTIGTHALQLLLNLLSFGLQLGIALRRGADLLRRFRPHKVFPRSLFSLLPASRDRLFLALRLLDLAQRTL